jgi:uncharacterized protein
LAESIPCKRFNAVKSVIALLPTNNRERWAYAFVSLTAGICEEVLFRGLVIYLLRRFDPSLSVVWLVVISSVIFGFAHAYQGVQGIVSSACIGALFYLRHHSFALYSNHFARIH